MAVPLDLSKLSKSELIQIIKRLEKRNNLVEKRVSLLTKQRLPSGKHEGSITGNATESFVSKLLNGQSTIRNADHDLVVKGSQRLEVKGSKCNTFKSGDGYYRRWTWHNFLGVGKQQKTYHRLILVGEAPEDLRPEYKDPTSAFVIFDLPILVAKQIAKERSDQRGLFAYHLMARPGSAKSSKWNRVVWSYQVTQEELIARYRL